MGQSPARGSLRQFRRCKAIVRRPLNKLDQGRSDWQNDEMIVIKAIVGDGIVKAQGDHQSNRRCEAVLGGDCRRGPIGNILRREFSQIIGERANAQEGGGSVRRIHRGSCGRRVLEIDTREQKQKGTLQSPTIWQMQSVGRASLVPRKANKNNNNGLINRGIL